MEICRSKSINHAIPPKYMCYFDVENEKSFFYVDAIRICLVFCDKFKAEKDKYICHAYLTIILSKIH